MVRARGNAMAVPSSSSLSWRLYWSALALLALGVLWLLLAPPSAQAMQACEMDADGYEICPTNPQSTTQPACDWECKDAAREERRRWKEQKAKYKQQKVIRDRQIRQFDAQQKILAKANSLIARANAARAAQRFDQELAYLRQAQSLVPDEPKFRLNIMAHLAFHGMTAARLAYARGEYSKADALLREYSELRRLDGSDLAGLPNYSTIKSHADEFAYSIFLLREAGSRAALASRIAAQEQAAADARARHPVEAKRAPGTAGSGPGPATTPMDGPVVIQRNPGALTRDAAAVARESAPEGRIRARTATESAQRLEERIATGRVFDGGSSPNDAKIDVPAAVPTPVSSRVISAADLARYNREPQFREASAKVEQARAARVAADKVRTGLANQLKLSIGGLAAAPAQADLAAAEKAAVQALATQRAAELAREKVIEKIEYGEAIMEPEQ